MDRYEAMRVFTRIVERRSFTLAAEDLGLPRATVTDAIKRLETRLGVRLLLRTTRQVKPTLDGEAYYSRCLRLIADLEDAESAFVTTKPKGLLRIDIQGTLARDYVFPKLPDFLAAFPDIELHVSEGDRFIDLVREGVDCVLRIGELKDSDMIARRLTMLPDVTCVSPAYCARFGTPKDLDDLNGHRMVGYHSSATGAIVPLEFRLRGSVSEILLPISITVTGAESYFAAGVAGFGLIQCPRHGVERHLAEGELICVLERFPPRPSPVSLLYPRGKQLSPRLRVFIDWIADLFEREMS